MVLRPYGCKIYSVYTCTQFFKNYFHVTETENSPFNSVTALNNIKQQVIQVIILKVGKLERNTCKSHVYDIFSFMSYMFCFFFTLLHKNWHHMC